MSAEIIFCRLCGESIAAGMSTMYDDMVASGASEVELMGALKMLTFVQVVVKNGKPHPDIIVIRRPKASQDDASKIASAPDGKIIPLD